MKISYGICWYFKIKKSKEEKKLPKDIWNYSMMNKLSIKQKRGQI